MQEQAASDCLLQQRGIRRYLASPTLPQALPQVLGASGSSAAQWYLVCDCSDLSSRGRKELWPQSGVHWQEPAGRGAIRFQPAKAKDGAEPKKTRAPWA